VILGIDPGLNGALSFYDGEELIIHDMPTVEFQKNGKSRRKVDIHKLHRTMHDLMYPASHPNHIFIEQVSAQPSNGAAAAFSYGYGCGVVEATVALLNLPYSYVSPQKWKKAMNCPKDKNAARVRASQLLPKFSHNWDRKKDDGRAESALIALYGYNQ